PSRVWLGLAGEDGEERGLAHAVPADERDPLAPEAQVHPVEQWPPRRRHDGHVRELEEGGHRASSPSAARILAITGAGPWIRRRRPSSSPALSSTRHLP